MNNPENLEFAILTKKYGETIAVDSINLKIPAGTYCCFLGPSGCGKTSTLRMIAGHEEISGGDILLGSSIINDLPPSKAWDCNDVSKLCSFSTFILSGQCCLCPKDAWH